MEATVRRDENGRFIRGTKPPAEGNPLASNGIKNRIKWSKLIKDTDLEAVYKSLRNLAISGNVRAIELYLKYSLGVPVQQIDINQNKPLFSPEELLTQITNN